MLDQAWVGRRVVVRAARPGPAGAPAVGDVVGELTALDGRQATVLTRLGATSVELGDIVAARLVEASTREIVALERIAARGWRAEEEVETAGWLLRADPGSGGFSYRANSVLALQTLQRDLPSALATAHDWYAERGLPLRIAVPLPAHGALDSALARLGWPIALDVAVMVSRLDRPSAPVPVPVSSAVVEAAVEAGVVFADRPDDRWLAEYRHPSGPAPAILRTVLSRHDRVTFASIEIDGQLRAIARGVVDDGWLGIACVAVHPDHRRRGLAQALLHALAEWGARFGATNSYLQVEQSNDAAITLYQRLGYWTHHRYRYRTEPTGRSLASAEANRLPLAP